MIMGNNEVKVQNNTDVKDNKIGIKAFCEQYAKLDSKLQPRFIDEKLKVKKYVPFIMKVTVADQLAKATYINKDGVVVVNSASHYLFFCKSIVDLYTNLKSESDGFYDEYDMLMQSGVLAEIMCKIPDDELKEFNTVVDMKKNDLLYNRSSAQAFVREQVERFGTLIGTTAGAALDGVKEAIVNLDDSKVTEILKAVEKVAKKMPVRAKTTGTRTRKAKTDAGEIKVVKDGE